MNDHLRRLFAYTAWADALLFDALAHVFEPPEQCLVFARHITATQEEWLARVSPAQPHPDSVWPAWSLREVRDRSDRVHAAWGAFLASEDAADLTRSCAYNDLKGNPYETALGDIVTHVVNHSTHHRGQIATHLRGAGYEVPWTDFIVFVRAGG